MAGSAPQPRPLVKLAPSCRMVLACDFLSACASVLALMNSTPSILADTMWSTALPPPPPTPITLITACWPNVSMSSNIVQSPSKLKILTNSPSPASRERARGEGIYLCTLLKIPLKPTSHSSDDSLQPLRVLRRAFVRTAGAELGAVEHQPYSSRKNRILDNALESADVLRNAQAHRHVEHFLGQIDHAFHLGATAGDDDAAAEHVLETAAAQLRLHQSVKFFDARLDHFRQRLARKLARRAVAHARHVDGLFAARELRQRAAEFFLDVLGVRRRRAQRDGDIVRDLIAGDRDHRGVPDRAFGIDR